MASVTLTIPDADALILFDVFAIGYQYNAGTDGTKGQFFKSILIQLLKNEYKRLKSDQDAESVRQAAISAVNSTSIT